jgi:rubrerythrin
MEAVYYIAGVLAAAVCVVVLARFVRRESGGRNVHLRHLLLLGVEAEKEGVSFYTRFERMSESRAVKDLCLRLAQDEARHLRVLKETLSRWRSIPTDEAAMEELRGELRKKGLFATPPLDTAEDEMLDFALGVEEKTAEFYASFEKEFPETWKKAHIEQLVLDERAHARDLRALSG